MEKVAFFLVLSLFVQSSLWGQSAIDSLQEEKYEGVYNGVGQRDGKGTYYWKDGSVYVGDWKADVMHGKGTLTFYDGSYFKGSFRNNEPNGFGEFQWSNGNNYKGGFLNGKMHGRGVMNFADGSVHDGVWLNGESNGEGVHTWADGSQYIGEWKNNKRHGKGIMLYISGTVEQGDWINDEFVNCECSTEILTTEANYDMADAVFVGQVFDVETMESGFDRVGLIVSQYWKGELFPGRKIYIYSEYSSCDFVYFDGDTYLVFAQEHPYDPSYYVATKCTRTRKVLGNPINKISNVDKEEINKLNRMVPCTYNEGDSKKMVYDFTKDPVCGCDGTTYKNAYDASKNNVRKWTAGPCTE